MKSPNRFSAGLLIAALSGAPIGCGDEEQEEKAKVTFPEAEPCEGTRVICADSQSIQTGSVEVTGVVEGATDCHKKGWKVVVGAASANVLKQQNDGSFRVISDTDLHGLLAETSTRVTPITRDGAHTLTVKHDGNKYLFGVERYAPAVVMACDCVDGHQNVVTDAQRKFAVAYCDALGFGSEANALQICIYGRPDHQDIQHDITEVYDGSIVDPQRNSCN